MEAGVEEPEPVHAEISVAKEPAYVGAGVEKEELASVEAGVEKKEPVEAEELENEPMESVE